MKYNILKAHKKLRHPTKLPENPYQRPSSQARPFEVPIFSDEHARLLLIQWQQDDIIKRKIQHLIFVCIYSLDAQASLAPTYVSWVGHTFLFPFCQRPWALAKRWDDIEVTDMVADTVADMVADKVADMDLKILTKFHCFDKTSQFRPNSTMLQFGESVGLLPGLHIFDALWVYFNFLLKLLVIHMLYCNGNQSRD